MSLKKIFSPAIRALKLYWLPFGMMQLCAISVVTSYYNFPAFQEWCKIIAQWKAEGGLLFSAGTTAVAAGIFPEFLKNITGKARRPITDIERLKDIGFNFCFFITMGILVDLLYRGQNLLFGNGTDWRTLTYKVLVDQFIWNPIGGTPYSVIFFLWREKNFNPLATFRSCNFTLYKERITPLLFTTWLYWMPMVTCIYSMPEHLQFPLYICVQIAWSLLMVFIVKAGSEPAQASAEQD